jgi:hypothetical protein
MQESAPKDQEYLPKEPIDLPLPNQQVSSQRSEPYSQPLRHEARTLLSWHAPGRPFKKRKKEYFINILILMLLIEVILFLFAQYTLMLLVVALAFVTYALNTIPPHDFRYKITTEGIMLEDYFYLWQELYDFRFKQVEGVDVLVVSTKAYIPGELVITLGDMHREHIKEIILQYLPFREFVKPTFMEKSGDWLSKTFPLERSSHTSSSRSE